MAEFRVVGAEKFLMLSKRLKNAGELGLRNELNKAIRVAAQPLIGQTRAAARSQLPRRGGLAELVAREPQRVQVRTGAKTAGVRIVVGKRRGGAQAANNGVIRHPVFGRQVFVNQSVPAGWFDKTLNGSAATVVPAVRAAMKAVARKASG